MQELKPVAWMRSEIEKADCPFGDYGPVKCYPDDGPLYALPATHRIVPVELLEQMQKFAILAKNHFDEMVNGEGFTGFSDRLLQGEVVCGQLRAIIDKEPT
jgi:hypothetical protein